MFNKTALSAAIAAVITVLAIAYFTRGAPAPAIDVASASATASATLSGAPAVASAPFKGPRSNAEAKQALMDLPELKAWSAHLEKSSAGSVHGALIEYGPTPQIIKDIRYWQISYVENTPEAAHRWQSFLVGVDTPDILIEDDATNTTLTLAQWRATKNPMARILAQ